MGRDGWYKSICLFIQRSGDHSSNTQILFFDGYDSHWNANTMDLMYTNSGQGFFLKAGDSDNDQTNENGYNVQTKSIYNEEKGIWDEQFVSTPFTPAMMNKVIAVTWGDYNVKPVEQ